MDNQQIAHDLAIAKLSGSDLQTDKLVEKYRQYYKEINDYLNQKSEHNEAKIISSPI